MYVLITFNFIKILFLYVKNTHFEILWSAKNFHIPNVTLQKY